MKIINFLDSPDFLEPSAIGVGTFDGVHLGHQALISSLTQYATKNSLKSLIFTFDHPPKSFLEPSRFPGEITLAEEKFALISKLGVDYIFYRPFDIEFANICPKDFIHKILIGKLNAKAVFVGFNFMFGLNRSGNASFLVEEANRSGVECQVLQRVCKDCETVSSALVREKIQSGDVESAAIFLGREAFISGEVVRGDQRGRLLGFPTANLNLEGSKKVVPSRGVYGAKVETIFGEFPALVNIGVRPTFDKKQLILEAHLIDFDENLYSTQIKVKFLNRLRDETKFPDKESLIKQITADLSSVKENNSTG
ncbi:MAG: bifunctional riboflavin kinase/FAD synthetase [Candidatus Riflebacteria bacterium]|nr:bifunctional riboflavin kinase/FAD synthetase [Candidatus Riflebacteria bacterium]